MIDWKRKLTSRKLWMAIVAFVTPLLLAFGLAESEVTQVTAIIMAGADVLAYILAEGLVDAKSAEVGTAVEVEVRGRRVACEIIPLPFYTRGK